ncbi:MAG: tRNA lysidine(34) synthetase TilS, partial [Candidatus Peregrinibacteria bacterium]|nr:tRNA lysidine(34) synthetase TilS [Candidatus Peregrinibacteria bacterium]
MGFSLILAISGGPDSVYLLHKLLSEGQRPVLAHFNHQLRGTDSDEDEKFVRELAQTHQLPCEIGTKDVKEWAENHKKSLEEAGRTLRYEFFEKIRQKHRANWILTAHHLNDNLETVLMNEMRGCKLRGQIGIQEHAPERHLWRPILNTPKSKILSYLKKNQLPYRTDATNTDTRFLRNHIRHNIIPSLLKENPNL